MLNRIIIVKMCCQKCADFARLIFDIVRTCHHKTQYRSQITYLNLVRYTTGKIWNPIIQ